MADVVQWHSPRVAACILVLLYVNRRRRNRKRWKNRKVWTKPYISRNLTLGAYNTLVQELRAEDAAAFRNFFRMDQTCFDELLEMVKLQIQKQDTNMRKGIPAGEKLALTLRYLATGEYLLRFLHIRLLMAKRASLGDRIFNQNVMLVEIRRAVLYISSLR